MTTYLPPIAVRTDPFRGAARREAARRWRWGRRDGKLEVLGEVESLAHLPHAELSALSATADLIQVSEGTVLATGRELSHWWWMPVEGWLLLSGHDKGQDNGQGNQALTIPSGWSWMAPSRRLPPAARLTALRGGWLLTASVRSLLGTCDDHPRLAEAISATLVGEPRDL